MKQKYCAVILTLLSISIMVCSGWSILHLSFTDEHHVEVAALSAFGLCFSLYLAYLNYKNIPK